MDTQATVKAFIAKQFLARKDAAAVTDDGSLLDSGLIDSTGIFEIVGFLETQFKIEVADEEIVPDNFETANDIVAFVNSKMKSSVG